MERITRLRQYFNDEESYNNLMNVYKELRGKENLCLRIFLKAIVICCLEAQEERSRGKCWMSLDAYFCSKNNFLGYYSDPFTITALKQKYNRQKNTDWKSLVFGRRPINYVKLLINHAKIQ